MEITRLWIFPLKVDFDCRGIFFCAYARKIREVQLLPLRAAFHELPLFY